MSTVLHILVILLCGFGLAMSILRVIARYKEGSEDGAVLYTAVGCINLFAIVFAFWALKTGF